MTAGPRSKKRILPAEKVVKFKNYCKILILKSDSEREFLRNKYKNNARMVELADTQG